MSKMKKKKLVPKLRFPEFRSAGAWEEKRFIDTADKNIKWSFIGGPFGSNLKSSDYVDKGVRIIQLQNIGDAEFLNDYKVFTSQEKANELISNNIFPGDIVLSKMGDPVGRARLIPDTHSRYVMCSDGIRLVVDEKLYSKYFIYSLINSAHFRSLVENSSTGSTRKRIGLDKLKKLPLFLPKKPEQQKIADCLASLDALITAHSRKLDALRQHKKGLMQQLFPAEGETVPKLRFPEFRNTGEWKVKALEKVADFFKGKGLPKSTITLNGEKSCIHYGELFTEYSEVINFVKSRTDIDNCFLSISNDVLMPTSDVTPNGLAKSCCIKLDNVLLGGDILVIRTNKKTINGEFLARYIRSREQCVLQLVTGTTVYHLYASNIGKLDILFPDIKEQQKIADCLSSLDALITAHNHKLDTLKQHKKGLMQQLIPSMDEQEE